MRIVVPLALVLVLIAGCAQAPAAAPTPTVAAKPTTPPAASPTAAPATPTAAPKPAATPAPTAAPKPQTPARTYNEQAVADFYRGKTVTIVVGYSPGGGYDLYARTLAAHIGRHIPGNPNVIVQNMPGAGSKVSANHLFNAAAKDGTVFGTFARGMPADELIGAEGVQFKSTEFNWIGSMNDEVSVCVARSDAPVKKFEDLYTTPLKIGGTGPGADTDFFPQFLNSVYGTKFELATGYPGGNDINVAIERGEVQGRCGWSWSSVVSTRPDWVKDKFITILVQMSVNKHPDLPDIPLVIDLAKTEEQRQLSRVVFARQAMGRPFVAPPGVPADRVAALRDAFDRTLKDPQFLADAEKAKLELGPVTGEDVQRIVADIFKTPPDLAQRLAKVVAETSQ